MAEIKRSTFSPVIEVLDSIAELIGSGCIYKRGEHLLPEFHLPRRCGFHDFAFCRRVKQRNERLCICNDFQLLPHKMLGDRKSFVHRCHAGAVELIVPLPDVTGESLLGAAILGPFRPATEATSVYPETSEEFSALPRLDAKKAAACATLLLAVLPSRLVAALPIHPGVAPKQPNDPRLLNALEYISRNFNRQLTLADAAAAARLSTSRFSHLFATGCGIDFSTYLLRLRLHEAALLLLRTEMSIGSIADAAGFSSASHFSAAFLRENGTSPRRFRVNMDARPTDGSPTAKEE